MSSMDIIRSLVEHKANVNAQLSGSAELHRFWQDHGDRTLSAGATPFMRAAKSVDVEVMRFLLDHGADAKLANKEGLNAPLLASGINWSERVRGTEPQALAAGKLCLEHGLDINASTERGDTAMHGAATRGANAFTRYLAEKGALLEAKNKQGFTPLDLASGKGGFGGAPRDPKPETAALLPELVGKTASISARQE